MKSLHLDLTDKQHAELSDRAFAEGLTLSNYLRRCAGLIEQQRGERKDLKGWGIRRHNHGGSSRQNPVLAGFDSKAAAERMARQFTNCPVCDPDAQAATFATGNVTRL